MNEPPITINLDASADVEPVAGGIAIVSPLVRVELSELLVERLTVNVLAARRRAEASA
jgi:hypothetical protein